MTETLAIIARLVPETVLQALAERLLETEGRRMSRKVLMELDFRSGSLVLGDVLPHPPQYVAGKSLSARD